MMTRIAILAAASVAALAAVPASADDFNWSYSFSQTSGSGTFTGTETTPGSGVYLITGITGVRTVLAESHTITSLQAVGGLGGNDNLLYFGSAQPLDLNGVSYTLDNGLGINLFYSTSFTGIREFTSNGSFRPANGGFTLNVTRATGAVPEPTTWAMLMSGFGLAGVALRRRERAVQAV